MARRAGLAGALSAVLAGAALAAAPVASGAESTFQASPSYPASTLAMEVRGKPRLGGIVTVRVTGSNEQPPDRDPDLAFDYTLNVYVMDRAVFKACPRAHGEVASRISQLPDHVEWIGLELSEGASGPFGHTVRYQTESFRKLLFCAYSTYVVDDAAMASLKHTLRRAKR